MLNASDVDEHIKMKTFMKFNVFVDSNGGMRAIFLSCLQDMRLYATSHLRVLHRARVPFFQTWCMEMLVTQLYDPCVEVAEEALDVLDEACEDEVREGELGILTDYR